MATFMINIIVRGQSSTTITLFSLMWVRSCTQMPTKWTQQSQHNMKNHESTEDVAHAYSRRFLELPDVPENSSRVASEK